MNYANLIQNITENIKTNGSQAITAQVLQDVLVDMVGELGQSGALLGGVIDTSFVPDSTNDAQVVYIAEAPGTYTNFNGLVVGAGEVAFFYFDGNAWAKSSVDVLEVVNSLNSTATDKALSAAMGKQLQDSLTQAVNDLTTAIGGKADRQTTQQALDTLQNQINDKADTATVNSQLATKADTATVNAALANKADTSYVNTQLATKADATATSTALAGKADKVAGAVAGNMASLDASGNLVDSGVPASAVGDVADKIDKVHDAEVGNVPMFKADGGIEDGGVAADNIAEQDGYYETMVVGGAENLIGSDIISSQFTRRKTGGTADVGTGVAILKTIKGNTVVFNQQVPDANSHIQFTATGSYRNVPCSFDCVAGHKYLVKLSNWTNVANIRMRYPEVGATSTTDYIITPSTSGTVTWQILGLTDSNVDTYLNIIDLTQYGNENMTVAEWKALFPLGNYAHNAGSLLSLTATGLQTNGFNQWDEEWESGYYDSSGNHQSGTTQICTKNLIPVLSGEAYYNSQYNGASGILYYDANQQFMYRVTAPGNPVTIPSGAHYVKINFGTTYGGTYNNNICINKSDANKNGTYEPYWTETKALPITTATSGGVAIFSDGMKSAGTAYDRYYKSAGSDLFNKAENNMGEQDLGNIAWTKIADARFDVGYYFTASLAAMKLGTPNRLCTKYQVLTGAVGITNVIATYGSAIDKVMFIANSTDLYVVDSTYSDAVAFRTAMAGVKLIYELATPTEYTLDTPFNTQYKVDNDGTETILPENTSTPTTSPIVADINYALNAIDTIRNLPQNYISKASMDAILTAFKTAGVITNYTLTWDATNQKYNCTITA